MTATLKPEKTRTRTPGVYRRGQRYTYTWRDASGRQRWATEDTEALAVEARARKIANRRQTNAVTMWDYALDAIGRYLGRTRTGIRELSRRDYRRDLLNHVLPRWGRRLRVVDITPRHVSDLVVDLSRTDLADATIRRILAPLRIVLQLAVEEGLILTNPAAGVRIPVRPKIVDDEDKHAKTLTDLQLTALLAHAAPEWRDLLTLLALTGLRISEALALRWRDLKLTADQPVVQVRRRYRAGEMAAPKTQAARRDVPLDRALVEQLRERKRAAERSNPTDLVFADADGQPLDSARIIYRAVKVPGNAAGVPWVGFHVLRHTCASRLFAAGRNVKQVQEWLGHHSPEFTLRVYVHLQQADGIGDPIGLPAAA